MILSIILDDLFRFLEVIHPLDCWVPWLRHLAYVWVIEIWMVLLVSLLLSLCYVCISWLGFCTAWSSGTGGYTCVYVHVWVCECGQYRRVLQLQVYFYMSQSSSQTNKSCAPSFMSLIICLSLALISLSLLCLSTFLTVSSYGFYEINTNTVDEIKLHKEQQIHTSTCRDYSEH